MSKKLSTSSIMNLYWADCISLASWLAGGTPKSLHIRTSGSGLPGMASHQSFSPYSKDQNKVPIQAWTMPRLTSAPYCYVSSISQWLQHWLHHWHNRCHCTNMWQWLGPHDLIPLQLQALVQLVTIYANKENYVIHPQKTMILPINIPSEQQLDFLKSYLP